MKKRYAALLAAVLMTFSMFSACGSSDKNGDSNGGDDAVSTSINVIVPEGDVTTVPESAEFNDPAASYTFANGETNAAGSEAELSTETEASVEATLPPNHQDIVDMIQNAETAATTTKAPVMKDYNVDCTTRYGYNQLNDAEKKLYKQMLEAAKSVEIRIDIDDSVTNEMWVKVFGCMYIQEPQLFWLSSQRVTKGRLWYWEIDPQLIASMQKEIDTAAAKVLGQAEGKSTYEKLKVFHDYIALNNNFVKEQGFNQTIYGGFVSGEIQCEGYAKTMQYLCDLSGIESMIVVGTNESGDSHAWNVVKVDGKWYNLDTTWDDPILTNVDKTNVRHRYFLVPDEWIHNKSHFNVNKKVTGTKVTYFNPPACTSEDMNYFKVENKLYTDKASADAALKEALKKAADSKLRAAEIRVSSKAVYDEITADLKGYASWIKSERSSVKSVSSNCDPNTLVIELDLVY